MVSSMRDHAGHRDHRYGLDDNRDHKDHRGRIAVRGGLFVSRRHRSTVVDNELAETAD
jgi:hypothetical protein